MRRSQQVEVPARRKPSAQYAKPPIRRTKPSDRRNPTYDTWIKENPVNQVKSIEGPYGLTRMYFKGDGHCASKVFHLFHDVHVLTTTACHGQPGTSQIDEFFDQLVSEPPYMIDFILETYEHDGKGFEPCYLTRIRNKFDSCFMRRTRLAGQCHINHRDRVRFHFNDVRLNWSGIKRIESAMTRWRKAIEANDLNRANFDHFMHPMLGYTIAQWDTRLRKIMKVDKQLQECAPHVRDIINKWVAENIEQPRFTDYMHALKHWYENPTLQNFKDIDPEKRVLSFSILIVYMDAYTVARCFRKFHQKQNEYSKDMRNIFLYTGGFHTENYIELLGRIGCIKDIEIINPTRAQCISVERFTPWKLVASEIIYRRNMQTNKS